MGKKHYRKHTWFILDYVKFVGYIQDMKKSFRARLCVNFYKVFFYHFEALCWIRIIKANIFGTYSPEGHNFTHRDGNKINGTSMVVPVRIQIHVLGSVLSLIRCRISVDMGLWAWLQKILKGTEVVRHTSLGSTVPCLGFWTVWRGKCEQMQDFFLHQLWRGTVVQCDQLPQAPVTSSPCWILNLQLWIKINPIFF